MKIVSAQIVGANVDTEVYLRQDPKVSRGYHDWVMSSSALRQFYLCPRKWLHQDQSPETEATEWGTLVDTLVTSKSRFSGRYAIQPDTYPAGKDSTAVKRKECAVGDPIPWNNNSGFCRDWVEEQKKGGKKIISRVEFERACAAVARTEEDSVWKDVCSLSDPQVMIVGKAEVDGIMIPLKCLLDFVPCRESAYQDIIVDLKTGRSAENGRFRRSLFDFGYHVQAALGLDLYNAATGENRTTWCFLVQESLPPYEPSRKLLGQRFIEIGRATYINALKGYADCLKSNSWPGYDDGRTAKEVQGWSIIDPDPWMEEMREFVRPIEESQESETDEPETDFVP